MNHNNKHPLVTEFYDLEEFGESLFAATPAAPKLSRSTKRAMLKSITKNSGPSFYKIGFGFAATAFAAFALLFGFAQTTKPGDPLYNLKVNGASSVQTPTIEQQETVKAEIQKQQTVVDTLKKTGAPVKEVKAAEKTLNKTIESGKKMGVDVEKVIEESRKSNSEIETKKEPESDGIKSGSGKSSTSSSSQASPGSNTSGSGTPAR